MSEVPEVTIVISGKGFAQIFGVVVLGNLTAFVIMGLIAKWNKTIKEEKKVDEEA